MVNGIAFCACRNMWEQRDCPSCKSRRQRCEANALLTVCVCIYKCIFASLHLPLALVQNPPPQNPHLVHRPISLPRLHRPHPPDHPHPLLDPPKNGMLPIQPRRRREGNEELRPIRVGPRVGHAHDAGARVPQRQRRVDLVGKRVPVDGGAAATGARGVAALDHEVRDDAVEDGGGVVAALEERREVGGCLGGVGCVEF